VSLKVLFAFTSLIVGFNLALTGQNPEAITSLEGADVHRIAYNGNVLVISVANHGIYYSSDNGHNWKPTSISGGSPVILIDDYRILVYTGSEICVSVDDCQSWTCQVVSQVSSLHFKDGIIYRDDSYDGYWKSTDFGATWTPLNFGFKHLQFNGNTWFRSAWGNNTYQVYRSLDSGSTWTLIPGIFAWRGMLLHGNDLWVLGNGVLYHSNDLGISWNSQLPGANMSHLYLSADTLYAIHSPYVSRSWDGGQNWETLGPFKPYEITYFGDFCIADNAYFACGGGGVYRSYNLKDWQSSNGKLHLSSIGELNTFEGVLFARTSTGLGYLPTSGSEWRYCRSLDTTANGWKGTGVFKKGNLYTLDSHRGLFLSVDTGKTWQFAGLKDGTYFSNSAVYDGSVIMVFEPSGKANVYNESTNAWKQITIANYTMGGFGYVGGAAAQNGEQMIYAGNYLVGSSDNGLNWQEYNEVGISSYMDLDYSLGSFFVVDGLGRIIKNTFQPDVWEDITPRTGIRKVSGCDGYLFALVQDTIYYSLDVGASWRKVGIPLVDVTDIECNDGYLYLGTARDGLWRWKIDGIRTVSLESESFSSIRLGPNPAVDHLHIDGLKVGSSAYISDCSGRTISEQIAAIRTIEIDLRTYSPGVYYLKYQSDNGVNRVSKFIVSPK
jgi:hypothetical protein